MPVLLLKYWKHILLVAIVVGAIYYVFNQGKTVGAAKAKAECDTKIEKMVATYEESLKKAEERYRNQLKEQERISEDYWSSQVKTEIVTETVEKEVIKYVTNNVNSTCELDVDFVRIWNTSNKGDSQN